MKALFKTLILAGALIAPSLASAATYTGSWTNNSAGTTGALTIEFSSDGVTVSGSFDFDGPVFGGFDPPAVAFSGLINPGTGLGSFSIIGDPTFGDITATFDTVGNLSFVIENVPGGFPDQFRLLGKFDLANETFSGTYEIDGSPGMTDFLGVAEAHVSRVPVIKAKNRVKFSGKRGKLSGSVIINSAIKDPIVKASGKPKKLVVRGKNPFRIILKQPSRPVTRVRIIVVSEDGLRARKVVKFIQRQAKVPKR